MSPRTNALSFPVRGQYYTSADSAVTLTSETEGPMLAVTDLVLTAITFRNNMDPNSRVATQVIRAGTPLPGIVQTFTISSGLACILRQ